MEDLPAILNERYRRLARRGSNIKFGYKPDFLRQLSMEDILLLNLDDEPKQLSLLAAIAYAQTGNERGLRNHLIAYVRLDLLKWSALPPSLDPRTDAIRSIGPSAIAALAPLDQECFEGHVHGVTKLLPANFGDPLISVFSNLLVGLAHRTQYQLALNGVDEYLAEERPAFDAWLVTFLRGLLLGDASILSESFERIVSLHRRSSWVSTRFPVNKYVPVLLIGLYFLAERYLPKPAFQTINLLSFLQDWATFIRYVERVRHEPAEAAVRFSGETDFLNEMMANPQAAQAALRRRVHTAWIADLKVKKAPLS